MTSSTAIVPSKSHRMVQGDMGLAASLLGSTATLTRDLFPPPFRCAVGAHCRTASRWPGERGEVRGSGWVGQVHAKTLQSTVSAAGTVAIGYTGEVGHALGIGEDAVQDAQLAHIHLRALEQLAQAQQDS